MTQGMPKPGDQVVSKPYVHVEYPKMLYKGGVHCVVHSPDAHDEKRGEGWSESPGAGVEAKPRGRTRNG